MAMEKELAKSVFFRHPVVSTVSLSTFMAPR